ncbi:hypothetical protein CBS115989_6955 [Aspergillus niger]|nr:hypothetical protein CBS115989_6955 [Aspergillus niger]KAI2850128.1 hypothetical protein CBS11232_6400 [Aspergillus niger]KAI2873345.1 hypothetical protein CBS115988_7073 [Aspergillus niger]KAI2894442.1 hypothetical protein CBS11852_4936 [Aspergillus niger]KAI2955470.1 hypothetical protein CBS147322_3235 [Aspergillus niger]
MALTTKSPLSLALGAENHMAGKLYSGHYLKPAITEATDKTLEVAARYGIGGHAAALRWTTWHSILRKEYGDSIIIGSSSNAQLESNIDTIEAGPLPEDVVAALGALYHEIGDEVHYHL